MTPHQRAKHVERLARVHAAACKIGDRELARDLFRMLTRHTRRLESLAPAPDPIKAKS